MSRVVSQDKIEEKVSYIAQKLYKHSKTFRIVTVKAILKVLQNPPKNPRQIQQSELDRINSTLIAPLRAETVRDILLFASEYDVEHGNIRKRNRSSHEFSAYPNLYPVYKLRYNV